MFKSGDPKVRNLTIHVDTGNTLGAKGLPLVYGHPDAHQILHATVAFESSLDLKAGAIEITFKAFAKTLYFAQDDSSRRHTSEQVFYSKQWDMDVDRPKPGWIGKGNYVRQCSVLLDPTLPSSSESTFGWMRYVFEARLKGAKGFGIARSDWIVTQEVWVLNSTLPFPSEIPLDNPLTSEDLWKDTLPYLVSIPADMFGFGQVMPVTIQLAPFLPGSSHEGEEAVVTSASFTLRETKTFRAQFVRDTHETSEKLLNVTVNTGWPQSVEGWQRTIYLSLPSSPDMSTSMQTKYLDVVHSLVIVVEFKTSKMARPDKLRAQFDIGITAPLHSSTPSTLPPQYGDPTPVESLLLIDAPPAIDAYEALPSYSRYE
ncbi:hypothetical protein BGZ98_002144 [Dissophora globulifera]|nr:hypothetical protein BGZ98_002144 [Dissophora globulifera]